MARTAFQSLDYRPLHRTQIAGIGKHNEREAGETVEHSNPDIDPERTHLNYNLVDIEGKGTLLSRVDERIKEGRTGKNSNRKIQSNAVLLMSTVLQVNKEYFDALGEEGTKEFFKASYDHMCEKYGKENVLSASVHLDEKAPHIHFQVVPLRDGRLVGGEIRKKEMAAMHTDMHKALKEKGFDIERGVAGVTKERLKLQEFKARELAKKEKELETKLSKVEEITATLKKVEKIEKNAKHEKPWIGDEYVKVKPQDFEELSKVALKGAALSDQQEEVAKLKKEIEDLKSDISKLTIERNASQNAQKDLQAAKRENDRLQGLLKLNGVSEAIQKAQDAEERSRLIKDHPNIYVYQKLAKQGKNDYEIAADMSGNFKRENVINAIADSALRSGKAQDSGKAMVYARGVVKEMETRHEDRKILKQRGQGGGIERGGSRKISFDDGRGGAIDRALTKALDGRGGVSLNAVGKIFRDDDREEYLEKLKSGVDMDFD